MNSVPLQSDRMRRSGKLKSWKDKRSYGFSLPAQGGNDICVHIKPFPPGSAPPAIGQSLTFEVHQGPNCKTRAQAVRPSFPALVRRPQHMAMPDFALVWIGVTRADG
jgi:cold shock CspA family protein